MTNQPHIIATALLLMAAFLIGCLVGRNLHRLFGRKQGAQSVANPDVAEVVTKPAPKAEKVASERATAKTTSKAPVKNAAPSAVAPNKTAAKRPVKKRAPAKAAIVSQETAGKPAVLTEARAEGKDNLKLIKGIGPKLEETLNTLGVYHFDQVASWDKKAVAWVDQELSFKGRIDREDWIAQAKEILKTK